MFFTFSKFKKMFKFENVWNLKMFKYKKCSNI
jgi:hypothetical protein